MSRTTEDMNRAAEKVEVNKVKKFLTALVMCGAISFGTNFANAAENDAEVIKNEVAETQDLDFWSRLRDKVILGEDDNDNDRDRHRRHEPPRHDDRRHYNPPPPPPRHDDWDRHRPHRHEPPPPPRHRHYPR